RRRRGCPTQSPRSRVSRCRRWSDAASMFLRSKLNHVSDCSWNACVPVTPVLNRLRKPEQCPIAVWAAHDLKRYRKISIIEAGGDRDGRKAQKIDESRETADRVKRGG